MIAFALARDNLPFAVALALMLLIALLEGVTTLMGLGLSGLLDSLLPHVDIHMDVDTDADADLDGGPDFHGATPLSRVLGWLRIGQVPVLILLIIFLTAFGLFGLGIQGAFQRVTGQLLPPLPAGGIALLLALPVVRTLGGILARIIPRDETDAVSESSFIGRLAVITTGTARAGCPAQGKLQDGHGLTHYVMIEPDMTDEAFAQGTQVILVRQQGATFKAIKNTSEVLGKGNDYSATR